MYVFTNYIHIGENEPGYVMLRSGEEDTVNITLLNTGSNDHFRIDIVTDASADEANIFDYALTPEVVSVQQNFTTEIKVKIFLHNAPIGFSLTFTLVAQSVNDIDISDYITFDVTNIQTVSSMMVCNNIC